jgi:hypothetical protein
VVDCCGILNADRMRAYRSVSIPQKAFLAALGTADKVSCCA